jgi:hypothetical protein
MRLVPDDELERLVAEKGSECLEADTLAQVRQQRAQDKQAFAYRLGEFYVVGPTPSAAEELIFLLAHEATKHMKRSTGEA